MNSISKDHTASEEKSQEATKKKPKTIIRVCHNRENPFVQINKSALQNPNLSLKARGLWALLLSYPNDWHINVNHLSSIVPEGRKAINSAMSELEEHGYLLRLQFMGRNNGRYGFQKLEYIIFEFPVTEDERDEYIRQFHEEHGNVRLIQKKFAQSHFVLAQNVRAQKEHLLNNEGNKERKETTTQPTAATSPPPLKKKKEESKEAQATLPLFHPRRKYLKELTEEQIRQVQTYYEKCKDNIRKPEAWLTQCIKEGWYREQIISDSDLQENFILAKKIATFFEIRQWNNTYTYFEASPKMAILIKSGKEVNLPSYQMNHQRFKETLLRKLEENNWKVSALFEA